MADNYNILEPTTTPSGTTQRSIRAIEVSSQLYAAAVMHTAAGTAIGHAEDTAHASDDGGIMALAIRRNTPLSSSGTAGDYSSLNVDEQGRLYVRPNSYSVLTLTSAAPTPSGTDITDQAGNAIEAADLAIRTTSATLYYFYIPFGIVGYTQCIVTIDTGNTNINSFGTSFNQAVTAQMYAARSLGSLTQELTGIITWSSGIGGSITLGSFNGATVAYASSPSGISVSAAGTYRFNVPEMAAPYPYLAFYLRGGATAPTSGAFGVVITRS